ncbi:MAG: DegT/DnrJ/EryC1/StrS family aminotransferase, partial [Anaerolineales bacterium]|nr:DegT/DnrJ/EryC1/StrS family aminotransferase [Anaerolineales bacterium]
GRPAGSLAPVASFSFYGNKIFTSGEGGAITLSYPHLELRIRTLRGQGMDPNRRYYFPVTGYNFRLTNVACAILCAQLERSEEIISKRKSIYSSYEKALKDVPGIHFQPVADWAEPAPWLFSILIDEVEYGCTRDELMGFLEQNGVETRPFFLPLHHLPPFKEEAMKRDENLPNTDLLSSQGINLPTFSDLSEIQIEQITDLIKHPAIK